MTTTANALHIIADWLDRHDLPDTTGVSVAYLDGEVYVTASTDDESDAEAFARALGCEVQRYDYTTQHPNGLYNGQLEPWACLTVRGEIGDLSVYGQWRVAPRLRSVSPDAVLADLPLARWEMVRTQSELERVVSDGDFAEIVGNGWFDVRGSATVHASGSATVHASGSATVSASDSATVSAYDSATVRASGSVTVRAYDSATVSAYDSATVHASGSATVSASGSATVRASGSATVRAYDSVTVSASGYVAVHRRSRGAQIDGGVVIDVPDLTVVDNWLAYHGLTPNEHGVVTLFKSVQADHHSRHGADYSPGATPEALDWRGTNECGYGLHFSPRPSVALDYYDDPGQRFVACPVKVSDLVVIGTADHADKVKAPQVAAPGCWDCDIDGQPITAAGGGSVCCCGAHAEWTGEVDAEWLDDWHAAHADCEVQP